MMFIDFLKQRSVWIPIAAFFGFVVLLILISFFYKPFLREDALSKVLRNPKSLFSRVIYQTTIAPVTAVSDVFSAAAPVPVYADNISQGKPTKASSYALGYETSKANDGNLTNYWFAYNNKYPQWWGVDLEGNYNISKIDNYFFDEEGRAYKYKIEVSADGNNWVTVLDKTNNTKVGLVEDSLNATGRYVRVYFSGVLNYSRGRTGIYESVIHGTPAQNISTYPGSQGKSVAASSEISTHPARDAVDGNLVSGGWESSTASYPQWISVDLGGIKGLSQAKLYWYQTTSLSYKYRIQASNDGVNYSTLIDQSTNTLRSDFVGSFPSDSSGRYLRLYILGNSTATSVKLREMQFFTGNVQTQTPLKVESLSQQTVGGTVIAPGGNIDGTAVKFSGTSSGGNSPAQQSLCVEVQPVGTAFSGDETCGSPVSYSSSPVSVTASVSGLASGNPYHWRARAKNNLGSYSNWVTYNSTNSTDFTVNPIPLPVINTFATSNPNLNQGGSATLTWNVSGAISAYIDPTVGTILLPTGSKAVTPSQTTIYTLIATNAGGSVTKSVSINVVSPPTATFMANPTSVVQGSSSTLTWSTSNATTVTLDAASVMIAGSQSVSPTSTKTYTLVATGAGGTVSKTTTVTVVVTPPVIVPTIQTFTANPASIASGQSATLSWTLSNATSATINQNVGTVSATSGTKTVSPTSTTTYTMTATNTSGSTTKNVTVTVGAATPTGATFNILNYGAKGDGVADDSLAFQKAFNAAHAANGGTVLFPSGKTYRVATDWGMPSIKTNDYFTRNADGSQVWSTPNVQRTGTIVVSGYGATIKHVATRVGFLHTPWTSPYWSTYGKITIEGFVFDNANTRPGAMTGRIFWFGGAGNVEDLTIKNVKLINVPPRSSTEYGGVNGIFLRADWTVADRSQPKWGFQRNITIQDADIQAQVKPIQINLETPSVAYGDTPGQNQYMIDNVLIERVKADNLGYYGSSIHVGSAASGKKVVVRDSIMQNSSDDGLEINSFDSILAENNTFSSQRQAICLVWFGYPFSKTPPTVTLRNNRYTGGLGSYWPQSTATQPAKRAPMIPEARAYTTDNQLKDRSWGTLIIDGGDYEFGVKDEWGSWSPTINIGSNGYPMSAVTIKNVKITADGPNSGDLISIKQGSQLGTTLPVNIENVQVRRSVSSSYAQITSADISTSGSVQLSLNSVRLAPELPSADNWVEEVRNFVTELWTGIAIFFEKLFSF
jgi:hypothetical protein